MVASQQFPSVLFTNEHACVAYLFNKRYPVGFICPFCGVVQKEVAPAYCVVCRYCRKQTSITAHTIMHGSKKNLISWMRVAWQFCSHSEGISAREVQHLMALSSYHTAWRWLQKIRSAAAIAEKAQCCGTVLFSVGMQCDMASPDDRTADICMALELEPQLATGRVRFAVLDSRSTVAVTNALFLLVERNATVFTGKDVLFLDQTQPYHIMRRNARQIETGCKVFRELSSWLDRVYHGAVERRYLQNYLDEFSFRYNHALWPDRVLVLDHLLDGLMAWGRGRHVVLPAYVEERQ